MGEWKSSCNLGKKRPLTCTNKDFIVLDSKGKFHYVGDLSTVKNELKAVFPLRERELKKEMKAAIKIKTEVAKLRSAIPSRVSTFSTGVSIDSVVRNDVFLPMINDNVTEFTRLSAKSSFDTNAKIGGFSYIQLMAVFRSINCFKHAISTNLYSLDDIARYAFTGENMEIIHILEQKGVSFDNTLENAPNCPYILFEWKVEHWEENNILSACKECLRKGRWHYALYFVKTGDVKPEDLFIDAFQYGSCFSVKHLIEKYHCNPDIQDNGGSTALHTASRRGYLDIVKYLVGTDKCDVNVKNNKRGEIALGI